MAETQQQQQHQTQDVHRHPEKNNAPSARNNAAQNNGTPSANNANGTATFFEGIRINPRYFTTVPGILKLIEWVLGVICIACGAPALISSIHWFLFVAVICFIVTFLWMCVHFITITNLIPKFPWGFLELVYTAIATVLYFIAMVVMLQQTDAYKPWLILFYGQSRWDAYVTAGVFALFNMLVYAVETAYHFKEWMDARHQ